MSPFKKKAYFWVTLILFVLSLGGHWVLSWYAYLNEQQAHHQPPQVSEYLVEVGRDTLENWQSEFLQLIWQVAGLAYLLYVGSPQSKEGDERVEEKLDYLLRKLDPAQAESVIRQLEIKYPKA